MNVTKCLFTVVLTILAIGPAVGDEKDKAEPGKTVWTFKDDTEGKIAKGFKQEVGEWNVVTADGEKVLAQQAKNSNSIFNLVLVTGTKAKGVDLSVKMKAVAGETDQGGGLVWRAKDKSNYYLARFNPLEENYRLYKVQDGKRSLFLNADIKATPGWHTLRVTMQGDEIECYFDGKKSLEHKDSTFAEAGMIGLWSKADAVTWFDNVALKTPLKE
jgi:hypothetical protein